MGLVMKHALPTIILAMIYLAPSIIGVINNRLDPSLESGLSVAYFAAAGIILGVATTGISALLSLQWPVLKANYLIVAICGVLSIIIFLLANSGALSVVQ